MKESNYKSYDELPLFLNAATVAKVLGIATNARKGFSRAADRKSDRRSKRSVHPLGGAAHRRGRSEAQSLADTRSGRDYFPLPKEIFSL